MRRDKVTESKKAERKRNRASKPFSLRSVLNALGILMGMTEKYGGVLNCGGSKLANPRAFYLAFFRVEDESDEVLENDDCAGRHRCRPPSASRWRRPIPNGRNRRDAERESLGGDQDRLTVILPEATGKQRFLRMTQPPASEAVLEQDILPREAILSPFFFVFGGRRQNGGAMRKGKFRFWSGLGFVGGLLFLVGVVPANGQALEIMISTN